MDESCKDGRSAPVSFLRPSFRATDGSGAGMHGGSSGRPFPAAVGVFGAVAGGRWSEKPRSAAVERDTGSSDSPSAQRSVGATSPTPSTPATESKERRDGHGTKRRCHGKNELNGDSTSIDVSPMMREQDADLLESMHYASSQVSQYSPGGTPILRPKDRSLPLDDLPMIPAAAITASPMLDKRMSRSAPPPATLSMSLNLDKVVVNNDGDGDSDSDHYDYGKHGHGKHGNSWNSSNHNSQRADRNAVDTLNGSSSNGNGILDRHSATHKPASTSSVWAGVSQTRYIPTMSDHATQMSPRSINRRRLLFRKENTSLETKSNSQLFSPDTVRHAGFLNAIANVRRHAVDTNSTPESQPEQYRRCLSGEVRKIVSEASKDNVKSPVLGNSINSTVSNGANRIRGRQELQKQQQQQQLRQKNDDEEEEEEEEETTASPTSVAQDVEVALQKKKELDASGLAEQRRVNEAMEFAQAVGERIPMRRGDELCIIEDNDEDTDQDDDDRSMEPKEIHLPACRSDVRNHDDSMTLGMTSTHRSAPVDSAASDPTSVVIGSNDDSQPPQQVSIQGIRIDSSETTKVAKRKVRPSWPFEGESAAFLDDIDDGIDDDEVVYKGICANPPEITKRGIQRGNYAQLHRKAWLEVSDKYHRYGKNLRLYYRYWEKLGFPTNNFFNWLDSKGEAAGQPLPNLDECPRSVLDADTVLYITNSQTTEKYSLDIRTREDGKGLVVDVDGDPVCTGPDGWIFVLRDGVMYGAEKITSIHGHSKQRFHHSSFFGGKAVASAGIILTDDDGALTRLYPHSGHYRPSEAHMQRMLYFLYHKGVDLRSFDMDTQQFRRVARDKEPKNKKEAKSEKKKKVDSLHLEKAVNVACFLAHKAGFIREGVFDSIHRIRKADVTSVSEALMAVDNGGNWRSGRLGQQQERWQEEQPEE